MFLSSPQVDGPRVHKILRSVEQLLIRLKNEASKLFKQTKILQNRLNQASEKGQLRPQRHTVLGYTWHGRLFVRSHSGRYSYHGLIIYGDASLLLRGRNRRRRLRGCFDHRFRLEGYLTGQEPGLFGHCFVRVDRNGPKHLDQYSFCVRY